MFNKNQKTGIVKIGSDFYSWVVIEEESKEIKGLKHFHTHWEKVDYNKLTEDDKSKIESYSATIPVKEEHKEYKHKEVKKSKPNHIIYIKYPTYVELVSKVKKFNYKKIKNILKSKGKICKVESNGILQIFTLMLEYKCKDELMGRLNTLHPLYTKTLLRV